MEIMFLLTPNSPTVPRKWSTINLSEQQDQRQQQQQGWGQGVHVSWLVWTNWPSDHQLVTSRIWPNLSSILPHLPLVTEDYLVKVVKNINCKSCNQSILFLKSHLQIKTKLKFWEFQNIFFVVDACNRYYWLSI